jgi:hypothetical protein
MAKRPHDPIKNLGRYAHPANPRKVAVHGPLKAQVVNVDPKTKTTSAKGKRL